MEEINEDRIMELFVENDIFRLLIALMHKHHAWFRAETHEAFVRFLNFAMARCGSGDVISFRSIYLRLNLCCISLVGVSDFSPSIVRV